jgi:hypothetical protein
VSAINGRADEPRGLSHGIASDASVAEASLITRGGSRVSAVNGRADEPRGLSPGIASDTSVGSASSIPLE